MASKVRILISHYLDIFYNKYYPLQILYRNRQRKRLRNRKFSLLTPNCTGGYLYHQLGLGFTSPTINIMIWGYDFKKFVLNLEHYLDLTPTPCADPQFPGMPCGLLDDIIIHFNHYKSSDEGIEMWEKRKKRLDLDNLYIMLPDVYLSKDDIEELGNVKCKKIVVLTSKDYGFDHCLYIPEFKGREEVGPTLGKTLAGKWKFEKYFDFVGWVNSDDKKAQNFYIGKYKDRL